MTGKKLSFTQRSYLPEDLNPKDWLYIKEEIIPDAGKVSKNAPKKRYMIIQHKTTQERRRIQI